jgi:hypothetical protein
MLEDDEAAVVFRARQDNRCRLHEHHFLCFKVRESKNKSAGEFH